jgi:hypothetical protein
MTVIHHRQSPVVSHDRTAWEYFGIKFYKKNHRHEGYNPDNVMRK